MSHRSVSAVLAVAAIATVASASSAYAQDCTFYKWLPAAPYVDVEHIGEEGGDGIDGYQYDADGNPKPGRQQGQSWDCKICVPLLRRPHDDNPTQAAKAVAAMVAPALAAAPTMRWDGPCLPPWAPTVLEVAPAGLCVHQEQLGLAVSCVSTRRLIG